MYGLPLFENDEDFEIGNNVMVMEIDVVLMKGKRNKGNPTTYVIHEQDDNLAFCPIIHFLAIAFADNAFDSEKISKPEDIYNLQVPTNLNSIQIKWKPDMQDKPIFRRATRTADGIRISLDKALAYDTCNKNLKRLGRSAGFSDNVTLYCLRRGVANVVDGVATDAERNQILGHSRAEIFQKYYLSQRVKRDVQSAYLGRPSKDSLIQRIGQMSMTRDVRAPTALTSKQLSTIARHPRVVELRAAKKALSAELKSVSGKIKDGKGTELHHRYTLASKELASEQEYLRRSTLEQLRSEYFKDVDTLEVDQQLTERPSSSDKDAESKVIDFTFEARTRLAVQLFQGQNDTARSSSRVEVLEDLVNLCTLRETPRLRRQDESSLDELDTAEPDLFPIKGDLDESSVQWNRTGSVATGPSDPKVLKGTGAELPQAA
ncbi:MAG: hypothetical protein M1816_008209 [Peltula sp. TS41687]|nr:MAG: hypothetical protein M1816_008209 [Peltula sp. TS41687]